MKSFASRAWKRIRSGKLDSSLGYCCYRFETLRGAARVAKAMTRRRSPDRQAQSLFIDVDADRVIEGIRADSYANLDLPTAVVSELQTAVSCQPCKTTVSGRDIRFLAAERTSAEQDAGHSIHMASYDLKNIPVLESIENDPILRQIAAGYLGFPVKEVRTRLFWSFVVEMSDQERLRLGQTVRFHYDLHGFNFLYFHFYLTDTDKDSGAHVLVRGSHHRKPLRLLFSSANQTDESICRTYGEGAVKVLTGPAGYGFAEDTFCYHKATPPVSHDRLMLQLRVS